MPPADQTAETPSGRTRLTAGERAQRIQFRRALSLVTMTLFLPGSAQFTQGEGRRRSLGRAAMTVWISLWTVALVLGLVALFSPKELVGLGSNLTFLSLLRLVLIVVGVGWAVLFVDAWRLGRPLELRRQHRLTMAGVSGGIAMALAGALLFSAHVVNVTHDTIEATFVGTDTTGANKGRYNVLLLGGDSGAGRWGLRPDSMTVASIDASTGRTVLISLPRNMANFPFPKGSTLAEKFPDGYNCDGCYLNSLSTYALDHPDLFPGKHKGIEATVQAIEGITDLTINYWAMVNMRGFSTLVDAVGGVKLNVRSRIPVGGLGSDVTGYIEPGTKVLNGHDTLWFARAREGSDDYSRMARQKCVMVAMLTQLSPQKVVTNFESIAKAGSSMVSTSVPPGEISRFADLAAKAKSQKIATVSLVPPAINTADPDMAVVHRMVKDAIARAEGKKVKGPKKKSDQVQASGSGSASGTAGQAPSGAGSSPAAPAKPQSVTGGSLGSRNEGYAANESEDLGASC